ncbi:NAD(P)-binding protein [Thozetella sp. PMI_491]|nr:NAD(P)-binding protein [Thozetella sp. PMI_491]
MKHSMEGPHQIHQGGCSGIGLAVAQTLLALGATVHVADIAPQAPEDLVGRENVHLTLRCDVTKRHDCQSFFDSIPDRLDGLVNCAGISGWEGKIGTDEVYQRTMDINVTGTWNMATEAMRRIGSIVNVGSGASLRGVSGLAAYTASKHAVLGLTRSWARDFPKLRINLVAPDVIVFLLSDWSSFVTGQCVPVNGGNF